MAFTGRLSNFQEHRAFVLAAYECGWDLSVSRSKRIVFNKSNSSESVPGFIFKPSEISSSNEAESLLLDYYRLKTFWNSLYVLNWKTSEITSDIIR